MKKLSTVVLVALALSFACSLNLDDIKDPRDGELGRLHFSGGGGCNNSTTIALGATAKMTMEPLTGEPLPQDLNPRSSAPSIISASRGSEYNELVLKALKEGRALIEILSSGSIYDRLEFSTAAAHSARYTIAADVFAGGHLAVKVDEIYGECGQNCPLIGGDFIQWSGNPPGAFAVESHEDRSALYLIKGSGRINILGREPSANRVLVDHLVEVLPADQAGSIRCKSTIAYLGQDPTVFDQCPLQVRSGAMMLIELAKMLDDGRLVPIAGADIAWTSSDEKVVKPWPEDAGGQSPEGKIFAAENPGQAKLTAVIALTKDTFSFDLTVTE